MKRLVALAIFIVACVAQTFAQSPPRTCVTINMKNGQVVTGTFIRANDDAFIIADAGGAQQTIKRSDFTAFKLARETKNKPCTTSTQRAIAPQTSTPTPTPTPLPSPSPQTPLPKESNDQPPPAPTKRVIRWEPGSTHSDSIVVDGHEVKGVTDYGLTVVALLDNSLDKTSFLISIENKSGGRIQIDPRLYRLDRLKPQPLSLSPLDPEKLARQMEKRGRWRTAVEALLTALAKGQTATAQVTDNTGYRGRVTVTGPDYETQREAQAAAQGRAAENQSEADLVRDVSLKPNTVFHGQTITGWIYFEKSWFDEAVLKITIGDSIYELPFKRK